MRIVGILLAAGQGSRFGSDKLLHPLADGMPMALAALRNLQSACDATIAVLRPEQEALAGLLVEAGAVIEFCTDAKSGMGHSLAAGVRRAKDADGWVIALGDMPFIQPRTIESVAQALRQGHSIVAPAYRGKRGHPVGFAAQWSGELGTLRGDRGARPLIDAHRELLHVLAVDDPGVCRDIDALADLAAAEQSVRRPAQFITHVQSDSP